MNFKSSKKFNFKCFFLFEGRAKNVKRAPYIHDSCAINLMYQIPSTYNWIHQVAMKKKYQIHHNQRRVTTTQTTTMTRKKMTPTASHIFDPEFWMQIQFSFTASISLTCKKNEQMPKKRFSPHVSNIHLNVGRLLRWEERHGGCTKPYK